MSSEPLKSFDISTVQSHATRSDIWITIHNKVYNVTSFLDEHPGGEEVILEAAGSDATEAFEDVGHSDNAKGLLKTYYIGELSTEKKEEQKTPEASSKLETPPVPSTSTNKAVSSSGNPPLLIPILFILLGFFIYRFYYPS